MDFESTKMMNAFARQPICYGTVVQNEDKDHPNQVKVQVGVLYEEKFNEVWANLAAPYGGEGYGCCFVPEVGDKVVVAFLAQECPIILASVYGKKGMPSECADNKENMMKTIHTKGGNCIQISDKKDQAEINIQTASGLSVTLLDNSKKVIIKDAKGKNKIELDGEKGSISLAADKKVSLTVGGKAVVEMDSNKLTLKNGAIAIQADQSLEQKGAQVKLKGDMMELNASAQMKISASGMTQIGGAMVKLG